ncbi:hypothetical protein Tco_0657446 [Tanacetum coccineum]|uniref:Uncharacterized protein n=1 Tax=Tanacetum coccineum TaxID=301880 RepID=A0ABQ4XC72_9ASTR
MDDPNITMEEYIRHQEEKVQRADRTFNWQTATYGKVKYYEDEDDCFTNFESEFPAIVFDDTSDAVLSCEPTVSPIHDNKIEFRISFDESDDEDYTPEVSYSNDLDFFKDFENVFPAIVYNDAPTSKSDFLTEPTDNDIDEIVIEQSSRDMFVVPLPNVINTNDGAYALSIGLLDIAMALVLSQKMGTDKKSGLIIKTDSNQPKMDKMRHGMEKDCAKSRPKSNKCQSQSQYEDSASQTGDGTEECY